MSRKLLKYFIFAVACFGMSSCINLRHYTFKLSTFAGWFFCPGLQGESGTNDGYYRDYETLIAAYKDRYDTNPEFKKDYSYVVRLYPQFTFYVPEGSDIRKEVFTRRLNQIGDTSSAMPFYETVDGDGNPQLTATYRLTSLVEDSKFWCYNQNMVTTNVVDQDLSLMLVNSEEGPFETECLKRYKCWVNDKDKYVKQIGYDTLTAKDFLATQLDTNDPSCFRPDTVNMLVFVYNSLM